MEDKAPGRDKDAPEEGAPSVPPVAIAMSGIEHPGQNGKGNDDEVNFVLSTLPHNFSCACRCYVRYVSYNIAWWQAWVS